MRASSRQVKEQRPEANPGAASGGSHGGIVRDETKHITRRPRIASLMRGAMWWIDRWRQSTAYTDMNAEEQGLYRNLLDDVWLREDHTIPDDPKILARVSGDPEAWARSGEKVLRWMERVDAGWTNATALEIKLKAQTTSEERSKAGKAGAEAKKQKASKPPSKLPAKPKHQYLYPYQDQQPDNGQPSVATAPAPWSSEAIDCWNERYGAGTAPGGRIGKALKPVVTAHGWEKVRVAWVRYLAHKDSRFANPQDFAAHFGDWAGDDPRAVPPLPL